MWWKVNLMKSWIFNCCYAGSCVDDCVNRANRNKSKDIFRNTTDVVYFCLAWPMVGTYSKKENFWIIEPLAFTSTVRSHSCYTAGRNASYRKVNIPHVSHPILLPSVPGLHIAICISTYTDIQSVHQSSSMFDICDKLLHVWAWMWYVVNIAWILCWDTDSVLEDIRTCDTASAPIYPVLPWYCVSPVSVVFIYPSIS